MNDRKMIFRKEPLDLTLWDYKDHVIIADRYPSYDNLYAYAFVHSRVKAYIEDGVSVDVFKIDFSCNQPYWYIHEGVRVVCGNAKLLKSFLNGHRFMSMSVHFLNPRIWSCIEQYTHNTPLYIWVHGSEAQSWIRRVSVYDNPKMVTWAVTNSRRNYRFWRRLFSRDELKTHFIFISQYFADEVMSDLDFILDSSRYSIIHNYINTNLFSYSKKPIKQRTEILSIRPYASKIYANDIAVSTILELSKKDFFSNLHFTLIGDGKLFEDTTNPVKHFPNVTLRQEFLTQQQIASIHKKHGIFLVPSRGDTQGVSRDEAMSSGLVPITNNVAAIPEFLDKKEGYLSPAEDYKSMAKAVEDLYKHPEKFSKMSEASARRVRAQSGYTQTLKKEVKLLQGGPSTVATPHKETNRVFSDPLSSREKELISTLFQIVNERNELEQRLIKRTRTLKQSESYRMGNKLIKNVKRVYRHKFVGKPFRAVRYIRKHATRPVIYGSRVTFGDISEPPAKKKFNLSITNDQTRIAAVMDDFTFEAYRYDAHVLQLTPYEFKTQINDFNPDFLFVESAWRGQNGEWRFIVSDCGEKLIQLVKYCQSKGIPTVFWNKEDPAHTATFIRTASLFDFVFTTDVNCIPIYRHILAHDRIHLLPFAAQPKVNNPIEEYNRKNKFNFAGAYYRHYKNRCRDFGTIVDSVTSMKNFDIYDRNFGLNMPDDYKYPEEYRKYIIGSLPFTEISKAYKGYKYAITMNTIKYSPTMFARRAFELLASNTITVSNYSLAIRNMLGDLVICSDAGDEIINQLKSIIKNRRTENKYKLYGLRKVMSEHTYEERLKRILNTIFSNYGSKIAYPSVTVIARVNDEEEFQSVYTNFERQIYDNKRLVVISNNLFQDRYKEVMFINTEEKINVESLKSDYYAVFSPGNYYGSNYLFDLTLATKYSGALMIGKSAYFSRYKNELKVVNDNLQYQKNVLLYPTSSIIKSDVVKCDSVRALDDFVRLNKPRKRDTLSIDEFNYCDTDHLNKSQQREIDGVLDIDTGIDINDIYIQSDRLSHSKLEANKTRLLKATGLRKTLKVKKLYKE